MLIRSIRFLAAIFLITAGIAGINASIAQDSQSNPSGQTTGKVRVKVSPDEAYIWVDGKPMSHRNSTLKLPAGQHKIEVYNYGYKPQVQDLAVVAGETREVTAHLQPIDNPVSGPWGRIQVEGVPGSALVFLNGTTPGFFVGHADEMNNHIIGDQQLIVPVGTYQVHILANKTSREIWSGPVQVRENERVIIYTKNKPGQELVYKRWSEGEKMNAVRRFEAGTASAKIAVAPVKGNLAVDRQNVKCGEPVKVSWQSTDAAQTTVTGNNQSVGDAPSGTQEEKPKQSTKYELRAAGPGGIITSDANVNVDTAVKTSLTATNPEIRYVKEGDQVKEEGSSQLQWTATNADSVTLDPIGSVQGASGSETVKATPQTAGPGPIDEKRTYKITATNVCGGSDTSIASVHVTGSIAPEQVAAAPPPPPEQLPATASPLPQLALLGVIFLGLGGLLWTSKTKLKIQNRG